jgi:hypothetical protein
MDDIIVSLENIAEQLSDRAIEVLKDAVASGASERPATEKTLTQARRAIEKAIHLLREI